MTDEELERRVADLEEALSELRRELREPTFRLRPPTPRNVLRLVGDHAIPALIAALEAQIHALELLEDALAVAGATDRGSSEVEDRVAAAGDRVLDRLDRTLADLQRALAARDVPPDAEARAVLADARELRDEVQAELGTSETTADRVDVEEELRTIKRDVDEGADDPDGPG